MKSLKVLFIANSIVGKDPGVSGGESRFIELGKYWQKKGYEIHLLSSRSGEMLCRKMGFKVVLHELTSSPNDNRIEFVLRTIKLLFYLITLSRDYKEGIVYSCSEQIYDTLPGAFLKFIYGPKIVFASAVHWLPPLLFWKRKASTWYNSLLFMLSERSGLTFAFWFADSLFPVSQSTYQDMHEAGFKSSKIHVVKCGVNLSEIIPIKNKYLEKKYEAVFLKRVQAVKGIFDLIEIWGKVVKKIPQAKLLIVGSGIDEKEAKARVEAAHLDNNVTFTGAVYDPEIKFKLVSESKLFLLPSYEENWAISIGEALACGTPVVCYRLKELEAVWEESIRYVELGDKTGFSDLTISLLNNQEEYQKLALKGEKYIKKYDWKIIAEEELKYLIK